LFPSLVSFRDKSIVLGIHGEFFDWCIRFSKVEEFMGKNDTGIKLCNPR
jgi:hypothetical protein